MPANHRTGLDAVHPVDFKKKSYKKPHQLEGGVSEGFAHYDS